MTANSSTIRLLLFLVAVYTASCSSSRPTGPVDDTRNWEHIAVIDSDQEPRIAALLKLRGIDSLIEGSVVYGVSVPPKDAARSKAILREDVQRHNYFMDIWDGKAYERHLVDKPKAEGPCP